jgi:hypothetical protein
VPVPTSRPRTRQKSSNRPRRAVAAAQPSFFERYRTPIIAGIAILGLAIVGVVFLNQNSGPAGTFAASGPKYLCNTLLTPGPVESVTPQPATLPPTPTPPTPSPAPSASAAPSAPSGSGAIATGGATAAPSVAPTASAAPSPAASASTTPTVAPEPTARLGFTTTILGRNHILNANQTITYGFCPPTSGDHYNISGVGPIRAAVYPNTAEQPPGGWVHNLEHGWVVLLYSCKNGCPSAEEMAQMQAWYDQAPTPDPSQGCDKEVLVARFDSMNSRFALLAWGRAYLFDTFDLETGLTFAQQWMDHGTEPETSIC